MKKMKKIAALTISAALVQSGMGYLPVIAKELKVPQIYAEDKISLEEACIARYNSIRITWQPVEGHTYKLESSEKEDGVFTTLVETLTGSEYVHEGVGKNQTNYYRIVDKTDNKTTAVFHNDVATGKKALLEIAQLKWVDDLKNRTVFDGTNAIDLSSQIPNVENLTGGTIILKGALDDNATNANGAMLGINEKHIGTRFTKNFGMDFSGLRLHYGGQGKYFTGGTHTAAIIDPVGNNGGKIEFSFDGDGSLPKFDNSGNYGGFFAGCGDITSLKIGATSANNANWKGTIEYVLVSDEVLSIEEVNAITADAPILSDSLEESDTLNVTLTSKYSSNTLSWDAVKGVEEYTILKKGANDTEFKPLATTSSLSYTDHTTTSCEYKVVAGNQVSEELTAKNGLESGVFYQTFNKEEGTFDGNKTIDLLNGNQELLNELKTLEEGSIVLKFRFDASTNPQVLFSAKNKALATPNYAGGGTNANQDAMTLFMKSSNELRADLKQTRAYTAGKPIDNENWHTLVFSNSKTFGNGNKQLRTIIDGKEFMSFNNSAANIGFFDKMATMDQLTLGGILNKDGTTVEYGLHGQIAYAAILDEVITDQEAIDLTKETANPVNDILFNNEEHDLTWVVTGGDLAQGSLYDIGGVRNYAGLFEEVIRWDMGGGNQTARQRFVINTAKRMQSLDDIDQNYETVIDAYRPKAVALMLDNTENLSENAIETHLASIVEKNLAANRYTVIQIPPVKDGTSNLSAIVDKVVKDKVEAHEIEDIRTVITVVNHEELFNADTNKAAKFDITGALNAKGHLAVANQLCKQLTGYTTKITEAGIEKEIKSYPSYNGIAPEVIAFDDKLEVSVSENPNISAYEYKLAIDGITISGNFTGTTATIKNLPSNKPFELIVQGDQGTVQLKTMVGTTTTGTSVTVKDEKANLSDLQKEVNDKLTNNDSLQWLFIGDSITHGAAWTFGYDSISQVFEKYVKDDLGRENDVIINTGVSGATLNANHDNSFIGNKDYRYDQYKEQADIVVIMLGTNDAAYNTLAASNYEQVLTNLVTDLQNEGKIVVLRTPNKLFDGSVRTKNLAEYANAIRRVAADKNCILVDHYKMFEDAAYVRENIGKNGGDWLSCPMNIHPNHLGQLKMAQQLIKEMGLWNSETMTCNMDYVTNMTYETSAITPSLVFEGNTITLDAAKLAADYHQVLGSITLEANVDGVVYSTKVNKTASEIETVSLTNIPTNYRNITVTAKASLYSANKEVTFENVTYEKSLETRDLEELLMVAGMYSKEEYFSKESYLALQEAIAFGKEALLNAETQEEIEEAEECLRLALESLEQILFTVYVNGEVFTTGAYNEKVTVTAPVVEGKEFTAWLCNGKVISTEETYTFFLSQDLELTPCYEEVEMKAEALLTNTRLTKREDTKADVRFTAQLIVPDGYTIKNAGLVWSSKEDTELSLDNENLKPTYITKISNTNQFSVTIKGLPKGRLIRGKIFATLVDSEGNETVVYSFEERKINR